MDKTMSILMFSGDYDKALAAFILANSAMELNVQVNMFFAFWGLSIIRDPESTSDEDQSISESLFKNMTSKGVANTQLSKMNFVGIGKKMLESMMEDNDTPTIEAFLKGAIKKGLNIKACKLSCEIMGFCQEELLEGTEIITAHDYLKDALEADIELFI